MEILWRQTDLEWLQCSQRLIHCVRQGLPPRTTDDVVVHLVHHVGKQVRASMSNTTVEPPAPPQNKVFALGLTGISGVCSYPTA